MKKVESSHVLSHSIATRLKHAMIEILSKFEDTFPDFKDTDDGKLYRYNVRNAMNDVIRATKQEISDYAIEYRPFRFNPDNTLSINASFLETVQKIELTDKPGVKIYSDIKKIRIMGAVRAELGAGVLYISDDGLQVVIEIVGVRHCIDHVIPFLDKYRLNSEVQKRYAGWRKDVVLGYLNQETGNVRVTD